MLDVTKKITHVQGQRRSPRKMVGGAKLHLESNLIPARDSQRAQTKPCAHQETPQRLSQTGLWVFECPLQRYESAVICHRSRGSGCSRPGYGLSRLEEVTINPVIELTQDWGNRLLEGTSKTLCTPGPRRKEQWPPQETDPDLAVNVQESLAGVFGVGRWWPAAGSGHWV